MRATMKIHHRAARFGSHHLVDGQIIATDGDEGFPVSSAEMLHHLEAGNATAIKAPAPEVTEPPAMETATPTSIPPRAAEPEAAEAPAAEPAAPRVPRRSKGHPKRGRRPKR